MEIKNGLSTINFTEKMALLLIGAMANSIGT